MSEAQTSAPRVPSLILWGATGQAVVLHEFLCPEAYRLAAVFDNDPACQPPFAHAPLLIGEAGLAAWLEMNDKAGAARGHTHFCVAIGGGRGADRAAISRRLLGLGLTAACAAHPRAIIARDAVLGQGAQILAGAVVAARAHISDWCIVNTKASVDHECRLDSGAHIGPGATLCGLVDVGENAFIGAGAVVLPRISIGAGAIVGAGAVVTRDVPDNAIVAGNPAKPLQGTSK